MSTEDKALQLLREELNVKKEFALQKMSHKFNFPHQLKGSAYNEWLNKFTEEGAEASSAQLNSIRQGNFSVLPIVCRGVDLCPHGHVCPFTANMPPLNTQCPMEQAVVIDRMEAFMREYQIDGHRSSDFVLLNRLVELELIDLRLSSLLSSPRYQSLMVISITGSTPQGELIENEIVNPILTAKEKVAREKIKILDTLVGTREAKWKREAGLKTKEETAFSSAINSLLLEVHRLEKGLKDGNT